MEVLDNVTIAGADKFDNVFVCRIPDECLGPQVGVPATGGHVRIRVRCSAVSIVYSADVANGEESPVSVALKPRPRR